MIVDDDGNVVQGVKVGVDGAVSEAEGRRPATGGKQEGEEGAEQKEAGEEKANETGREKVAAIGGSKKRKAGKVIGADAEDEEHDTVASKYKAATEGKGDLAKLLKRAPRTRPRHRQRARRRPRRSSSASAMTKETEGVRSRRNPTTIHMARSYCSQARAERASPRASCCSCAAPRLGFAPIPGRAIICLGGDGFNISRASRLAWEPQIDDSQTGASGHGVDISQAADNKRTLLVFLYSSRNLFYKASLQP